MKEVGWLSLCPEIDEVTANDEKGKKIARVQETIGPTKSPYVSAVLVDDRAKRVIGMSVYT